MGDLAELSPSELKEMAKLQFSMFAEAWAALTKADPSQSIAKMNTRHDGIVVGIAIMGQEAD